MCYCIKTLRNSDQKKEGEKITETDDWRNVAGTLMGIGLFAILQEQSFAGIISIGLAIALGFYLVGSNIIIKVEKKIFRKEQ